MNNNKKTKNTVRAKDTFVTIRFWCQWPTTVVWGRTRERSAGTGNRGETSVKKQNKRINIKF